MFLAEGEKFDGWLQRHFGHIATQPLAARHIRLWEFFDQLAPGLKPRPEVHIWPRGGAKSSTVELACAYLSGRLTRRFVLYVSGTQEQADKHVSSIATRLEQLGVQREVGRFGSSKGWRRNELRAASGFYLAAIGLDTAARGIKLDDQRPDLILFDDVDGREDTPETSDKKQRAITQSILPAGSSDCAVLFVQNLILEDGIFGRLASDRATFLFGRWVSPVEPAVVGLEYERFTSEDGANRFRITAGEATWAGQSLETCEMQLNEWGPESFLREAQHQVRSAGGYFFDDTVVRYCDLHEVPRLLRIATGWDEAATQGGGDYTAGVTGGIAPNGVVYVLDVVRGQISSEKVDLLVLETGARMKAAFPGRPYSVRLPQDPGQAGKYQRLSQERALASLAPSILPVTGAKSIRATPWAKRWNGGNVVLLRADWNFAFVEEHRRFREDGKHSYDDQVDAAADMFKELDDPVVIEAPRTQAPKDTAPYEYAPLGAELGAYDPL